MVNWGTESKEPMARFPAFFAPKDLYDAFKAKCKREGVPMAQILRAAMAAFVKEANND